VDPSGTLWAAVKTGVLYLPKGAHSFEDAGVQAHQIMNLASALDGSMVYTDLRKASEPQNVCRLQIKPGGSVVRCIFCLIFSRPCGSKGIFVVYRRQCHAPGAPGAA
jgi:hypothetical protein